MLQLKDIYEVAESNWRSDSVKKRGRCLIDNYYFEASVTSFQATILNFGSTDKTHKSPPFKQNIKTVA